MSDTHNPWIVYMLRCSDQTLYTGITTDLDKRIQEHNHSPRGAKYTRSRRPVSLVYQEIQPDRSLASAREYAIKQLKKKQKEELIAKFNGKTI